MIFSCKIAQGRITTATPQRFAKFLETLEGEKCWLDITKYKKARSGQQNNYYWGVVLFAISAHTGHSTEELHRIFKGLFLPRRVVKYKDKEYTLTGSTKDLTTSDFVEYMDRIIAEAGELGIHIQSPEEAGFITGK